MYKIYIYLTECLSFYLTNHWTGSLILLLAMSDECFSIFDPIECEKAVLLDSREIVL